MNSPQIPQINTDYKKNSPCIPCNPWQKNKNNIPKGGITTMLKKILFAVLAVLIISAFALANVETYIKSYTWRIDFENSSNSHWNYYQEVRFANGYVYNRNGTTIIGNYYVNEPNLITLRMSISPHTFFFIPTGDTPDVVGYFGERHTGDIPPIEKAYMRRQNPI